MKFIAKDLEISPAKTKSPEAAKAAFLDYIRPRYAKYKWQKFLRSGEISVLSGSLSVIFTVAGFNYAQNVLGLNFDESKPFILGPLFGTLLLGIGGCALASSKAKIAETVEAFQELYPRIAQEALRELETERGKPQAELEISRSKRVVREEIPGIELKEMLS